MGDVDELYTLKNHFWTGNFQLAVQEAQALTHVGGDVAVDRDVLMYKSLANLLQRMAVVESVLF